MSWSYELGEVSKPENAGTRANPVAADEAEDIPPISQYEEIIGRPLFMADRRPHEPETQEEPEPVNTRPVPETKPAADIQYTLTAVIIDGDNRVALIKPAGENKTSIFNEGDMLDGWTISEIRKNRVILERGGQSRNLELKVAPSQNGAGVSGGPAPESASPGDVSEDSTGQGEEEELKSVESRRQEELPENRRVFDLYNDPAMKGSDLLREDTAE